jgi:hypothetical protein
MARWVLRGPFLKWGRKVEERRLKDEEMAQKVERTSAVRRGFKSWMNVSFIIF